MNLRHFLLLALCCLAPTLVAARYPHREPFSQTHAFQPDAVLELRNINGAVTVRTWDRNEIRIEGEKQAQTEEELQLIDLDMQVTEQRAAVRVKLPKRNGGWFGRGNTIRAAVTFTVTVPATTRIQTLATVNSPLTLSGLRGPVQAETVNGAIKATDLSGNAELETVNGTIEADFAALAPRQELTLDTVNGRITLRLPADAGAALDASVVNGKVQCDFPLEGGRSGRRSLTGTIGDGRARVNAETVNGSIHITRR